MWSSFKSTTVTTTLKVSDQLESSFNKVFDGCLALNIFYTQDSTIYFLVLILALNMKSDTIQYYN